MVDMVDPLSIPVSVSVGLGAYFLLIVVADMLVAFRRKAKAVRNRRRVRANSLARSGRARGHELGDCCLLLEILSLGLEAGMTLEGCLQLFVSQVEGRSADMVGKLLAELRVGKSRQAVLAAAADDIGGRLGAVFAGLYRGRAAGAPLRETTEALLLEFRQSAQTEAREALLKAPIKMLFPLVGLILPSLMTILLAPAALRVLSK